MESEKLEKSVVTEMEFDDIGCLLAVASKNGAVRIFDFDEYAYISGRSKRGEMSSLEATLDFWSRKDVKRIRWNPSNQSEIALGFRCLSAVHIFDLERSRREVVQVRRAAGAIGQNNGIGCCDIRFVPKRPSALLTLNARNVLQCADRRRPSKRSAWEIELPSDRPSSDLCVDPEGALIYCASGSKIHAFDIRRLHMPAFSARSVPTAVFQIDVGSYCDEVKGDLVVRMGINPCVPSELACVLSGGSCVAVDTVRKSVTLVANEVRSTEVPPLPLSACPVRTGFLGRRSPLLCVARSNHVTFIPWNGNFASANSSHRHTLDYPISSIVTHPTTDWVVVGLAGEGAGDVAVLGPTPVASHRAASSGGDGDSTRERGKDGDGACDKENRPNEADGTISRFA
eukprot:g87.t1